MQPPPKAAIEGPFVSFRSNDKTPNLGAFDVVIADGVSWPALVHDTVFLVGNFIWDDYHHIQSGRPTKHLRSLEGKIRSWIGFDSFAFPTALQIPRILQPIPAYYPSIPKDTARRGVWLAVGRTGDKGSSPLLKSLVDYDFVRVRETYNLAGESSWPSIVIGRPGFGTIRDCLEFGIPFRPAEEYHLDCELQFNKNVLQDLGLLGGAAEQNANLLDMPSPELTEKWETFSSNSIDRREKFFQTLVDHIDLKVVEEL